MLDREIVTIETTYGPVLVKLGRDPNTKKILNLAPEFESVRAVANQRAVPTKQVYAATLAAAAKLHDATD
jgi:uncharacterized protein (DUF111 family)